MELSWQWFLVGLPLVFALGWIASRLDLRQLRRESRDSPRAYYKGLNLLLNEQQDKAVDAFIEALQNDPETADLHFALGNLFRRRGEFERAVRVHQHLLQRADLPAAERDRAQHALAQDFVKAGLFDRAEASFRALEGTAFDAEAQLALLGLHERARDWPAAIAVAQKLERAGAGSFAARIAHFWCELAVQADQRKAPAADATDTAQGSTAIAKAIEACPNLARPWVLAGQRHAAAGRHAQAVDAWLHVAQHHPAAVSLVARDLVVCAQAAGQVPAALAALQASAIKRPSFDVAEAIGALVKEDASARQQRLTSQLKASPTLSAAAAVLRDVPSTAWAADTRDTIVHAVQRAAKPLHRYRCAACGFEAEHYFWQCPGCLGWDTFPAVKIEEL
jgi:lipopolysaccharide assembly protein B